MSVKIAKKRLDDLILDVTRAKDRYVAALTALKDKMPENCHCERDQLDVVIRNAKEAHYSAVGVSEVSKEKILKELSK